MLLDTYAVKPLISIFQNRIDSKYIKQNETENQLKRYQIISNFKYYQNTLSIFEWGNNGKESTTNKALGGSTYPD
jgi:hypothetical protein